MTKMTKREREREREREASSRMDAQEERRELSP